jgi:hypothetical protein
MELGLIDADALAKVASSNATSNSTTVHAAALDASGEGTLGEPNIVLDARGAQHQATLEDRGVHGAFLSCGDMDLPLAFAKIECDSATVTVTVHETVHPGCEHKGIPIALTCCDSSVAETWQHEIDQANEHVNGKHWGTSKGMIREQWERWEAERERCDDVDMTVAQYFHRIGLEQVYDETWSWCAGVLAGIEAKEEKSVADITEINYYKRKVEKTELYSDMELTDYMNILKHTDLVPAGKQVSYASFIAEESDRSGHRNVGKATVFVSHVWKMTVRDFFEVCLAEMADDDYAWIDLYLHNQYQGAVSTIGDENSMYWINKFGELIAGIGKVVAIVTDWEKPVMLTRIWCLFELNAAIDTGAELKFVATAAQRQELSLNLDKKFQGLGTIVSNVEVRDCDAKRPHEILDKAIFLGKLRGIEDEVNDKLRTEMQRWLCEAANGVIQRTDPHRPRLDRSEMMLEQSELGEGSYCSYERSYCCFPMPSGAKLTLVVERLPWLGPLLRLLGFVIASTACLPVMDMFRESADGSNSSSTSGAPVYYWIPIWPGHDGRPIALLIGGLIINGSGQHLIVHQQSRQLRQPPMCGTWATRHQETIGRAAQSIGCVFVPVALGLSAGASGNDVLLAFLAAYLLTFGLVTPLSEAREAAGTRASLCCKAAWLRLKLGDSNAAAEIFGRAQGELTEVVGVKNTQYSWIAVAGHVRALVAAGRHSEAEAAAAQVPRFAEDDGEGLLLRAGLAAALQSPDAEVLALLLKAAEAGCDVPAGGRCMRKTLGAENGLCEWDDFMNRMAENTTGDDQLKWEQYRTATVPLVKARVASIDTYLEEALLVRGLPLSEDDDADIARQTMRSTLLRSYFEHPAWALTEAEISSPLALGDLAELLSRRRRFWLRTKYLFLVVAGLGLGAGAFTLLNRGGNE